MDDERWRLFPVVRADTSGLLIVDTELLDLAPLTELPIAVLASLELEPEMTKPMTDHLEDELQGLIEQAGGRPAGHFRSADKLLSVGYLPALPAEDLQFLMSQGWTNLNFSDDPEWSTFTNLLAVSPREEQGSDDLLVAVELGEHGDQPTEPRPVDYQVTFPDPQSAETFLDEICSEGFFVSDSTTVPGRVDAQITRTDSIGWPPEGISQVVWHVRNLAETHGGTLTGWGAPIVTGNKRTKRRWRKK